MAFRFSTRRARRSHDSGRGRWIRRLFLAPATAAALLLVAGPAAGYRIYLKDGTVVATKNEYRVEGDLALATLENGAQTTIRLSEIDIEKTKRLNDRAYTSAVVIEGGEERLLSLDDPAMRQRTLAEYVEERRRERKQRATAANDEERQLRVRLTPAGYVDLKLLDKERLEGPTADRIDEALARNGLSSAQLFRGTADDRYLVEVITNSEQKVFDALEGLAAAVIELADAGVAIDAFEVYMANESGSRAGMFTLSEENSALLASDQIEPDQFFLQFVEF